MPRAFKLGHLHPFEPILFWQFSTCLIFLLGGQFLLPMRANSQKSEREIIPTPEMDEAEERFQCLGHSNWTICIPLSPFCSGNFPLVSSFYCEVNLYYPRARRQRVRKGNYTNSRNGKSRMVSVIGAFKQDHLHPFKPSGNFSICHIFIQSPKRSLYVVGRMP